MNTWRQRTSPHNFSFSKAIIYLQDTRILELLLERARGGKSFESTVGYC